MSGVAPHKTVPEAATDANLVGIPGRCDFWQRDPGCTRMAEQDGFVAQLDVGDVGDVDAKMFKMGRRHDRHTPPANDRC